MLNYSFLSLTNTLQGLCPEWKSVSFISSTHVVPWPGTMCLSRHEENSSWLVRSLMGNLLFFISIPIILTTTTITTSNVTLQLDNFSFEVYSRPTAIQRWRSIYGTCTSSLAINFSSSSCRSYSYLTCEMISCRPATLRRVSWWVRTRKSR